MDYFKELLDSYNKLKKRTFKLEYLNEEAERKEEDGPAPEEAINQGAEMAIAAGDAAKNLTQDDDPLTQQGNKKNIKVAASEFNSAGAAIKINFGNDETGEGKGPFPLNGFSWAISNWPPRKWKDKGSNAYKVALAFYGSAGDDAANRKQKRESELEERQQRFDTPGALAAEDKLQRFPEGSEINQTFVTALTEAEANVIQACNDNLLANLKICPGQKAPLPGEPPEQTSTRLVGGASNASFERRILNGQTARLDDKGNLLIGQGDIPAETLADVAESFQQLTAVLTVNKIGLSDEQRKQTCQAASEKIAYTNQSRRIVIFGSDRTTGVAISNTDTSRLQKAIISKIESLCGPEAIEKVTPEGSVGSLNEERGRFNEEFLPIFVECAVRLEQLDENPPRGVNAADYNINPKGLTQDEIDEAAFEAERAEILQYMAQKLRAARHARQKALGILSAQFDPENAINLEDVPLIEELLEQTAILNNTEKMTRYFRMLAMKNKPLIDATQPDQTLSMGTSQRIGGKIDTYFAYYEPPQTQPAAGPDVQPPISRPVSPGKANAQERAQEAATNLGLDNPVISKTPAMLMAEAKDKEAMRTKLASMELSELDNETRIWVVGLGQKISQGGEFRLGQTTLRRVLSVCMGNLIGANENAPPEDPAAYKRKIDGYPPIDSTDPPGDEEISDQAAFEAFAEGLLSDYDTINKNLTQDIISTTDKGEDFTQTPEQVGEYIRAQYLDGVPYVGKSTGDPVRNSLERFNIKDGEIQETDLRKGTNRERLIESVQRASTFQKIRSGLRSTDPQERRVARAFVVRAATMTAMNMEDMSQVAVRESGSTISYNQNDIADGMKNAYAAGEYDAKTNPEGLEIISQPGTMTATVIFPYTNPVTGEKTRVAMKVSTERQGNNPNFLGNISEENAVKLNELPTVDEIQEEVQASSEETFESIADGAIYKFLRGQHQLLEDLLN
jgi:hypothetical protein